MKRGFLVLLLWELCLVAIDAHLAGVTQTSTFTNHGYSGRSKFVFEAHHFAPIPYRSFVHHEPQIQPNRAINTLGIPLTTYERQLRYPEQIYPFKLVLPRQEEDFSDPFLITGIEAKNLVDYLYKKGLFFSDYPHTEALLRHQVERQENGLEGNRLSSNRPDSIFYRDD